MTALARHPRLAAWVIVLALIALLALRGAKALPLLEPPAPAGLAHIQGVIIAVHPDSVFGVQIPGQSKPQWFRPAPGAPISLDHLLRHLHERATTDIAYQPGQTHPIWLAWQAD
jgi:hypothetical protein